MKQRIVDQGEHDTDLIFRTLGNTSRVARNAVSAEVLEIEARGGQFEEVRELVAGARGRLVYETGDLDAGVWSVGMVQGLIHDVPTVAELIDRILAEADQIIAERFSDLSTRAGASR